jgi:hypothetical protein
MAKHVKVTSGAGGNPTVEISVESLEGGCMKQLEKHFDSDGTVRWQDDNRYFVSYTVTGTVTLAGLETLRTAQQTVRTATHPILRVYDKSAADYYNDYAGVQIPSLRWSRVTDSEWRVTITFEW